MDLARVGTYGSVTEASLVKARLGAHGIEALVQADTAAGTVPNLAATEGVKVLVRQVDLAAALEILERMLPEPGPQPDQRS